MQVSPGVGQIDLCLVRIACAVENTSRPSVRVEKEQLKNDAMLNFIPHRSQRIGNFMRLEGMISECCVHASKGDQPVIVRAFHPRPLTPALSGPRQRRTRRRRRHNCPGACGALRQTSHGPLQRIVRSRHGMVATRRSIYQFSATDDGRQSNTELLTLNRCQDGTSVGSSLRQDCDQGQYLAGRRDVRLRHVRQLHIRRPSVRCNVNRHPGTDCIATSQRSAFKILGIGTRLSCRDLTPALSGPPPTAARRRRRHNCPGACGAHRQTFHGPLQRIVRHQHPVHCVERQFNQKTTAPSGPSTTPNNA